MTAAPSPDSAGASASGSRRPVEVAPATEFAASLIAEFVRLGVRDFVVCPGSRSQALALAAAEAERLGYARLHVRIDERSAAYFALGVARETGMPAPVIVTSGTAVANLVPAALEAHEGRIPLIAVTADRPEEAQGNRTSQTTRQADLFGVAARLSVSVPAPDRAFHDASAELTDSPADLAERALTAALGAPGRAAAGPVQLNLAFREPLSSPTPLEPFFARQLDASDAGEVVAPADAARRDGQKNDVSGDDASGHDSYLHDDDALAVVVAGEGAGDEAEEFAHAAGLPLLAEVVSGARFGREMITGYATLIDDPAVGGLIERVIVFGHPTLTRQVPALAARGDVEVVVVDPHPASAHYDPARTARVVREARVSSDYDPATMRGWLGAWIVPDRELRQERSTIHEPDLAAATATGYRERSDYARAEVATMREPVSRELLVDSVWRATWPHDRLVIAASRLVRTLDGLAQPRRVSVHANRGLAGIDGTIATALGIAATSQEHEDDLRAAGTTRVLLGDLALLHDVGSLALTPGEPRPRIQLIVGNDGGGTIFDRLEVADSADSAAFDRVMYTPQQVEIEQLAAAYGWEYRRVATRAELERLFTQPVTGPTIVEVPLTR